MCERLHRERPHGLARAPPSRRRWRHRLQHSTSGGRGGGGESPHRAGLARTRRRRERLNRHDFGDHHGMATEPCLELRQGSHGLDAGLAHLYVPVLRASDQGLHRPLVALQGRKAQRLQGSHTGGDQGLCSAFALLRHSDQRSHGCLSDGCVLVVQRRRQGLDSSRIPGQCERCQGLSTLQSCVDGFPVAFLHDLRQGLHRSIFDLRVPILGPGNQHLQGGSIAFLSGAAQGRQGGTSGGDGAVVDAETLLGHLRQGFDGQRPRRRP
mmetsp:Transcript_144776/g.463985  ORF Transcript_144776/g.463985 Transcript_144776/m.463985 type:complete len:267 (+) Transcript_144776:451-1251(+)